MEASAPTAGRAPGARLADRWARARSSPYLLLLPAAVALAAVAAYPLIYGIRSSFERYRFGRDLGSAGWSNYRAILHGDVFWTAVGAAARSVFFAVTLPTPPGP